MTEAPNFRDLDTCDNCDNVIRTKGLYALPQACNIYPRTDCSTSTVCDKHVNTIT